MKTPRTLCPPRGSEVPEMADFRGVRDVRRQYASYPWDTRCSSGTIDYILLITNHLMDVSLLLLPDEPDGKSTILRGASLDSGPWLRESCGCSCDNSLRD
jgi:hypothetical protein